MDAATAIARIGTRRRIAACTACDLSSRPNISPVPFSGPTPARYVVLGEAPGRSENRKAEPFVGASGRFLRRLMRGVGLDDAEAFWCNTACCWPPGAPTQAQQNACRPHLIAQLKLARAPFLLAAGGVALNAVCPDANLRRLHGSALKIRVRVPAEPSSIELTVVPVYHPAFVAAHDPSSKPVLQEGLGRFKALLDGIPADLLVGNWCNFCEHRAVRWDQRQMPYCLKHSKEIGAHVRLEKRRAKAEYKASQGRLL